MKTAEEALRELVDFVEGLADQGQLYGVSDITTWVEFKDLMRNCRWILDLIDMKKGSGTPISQSSSTINQPRGGYF